LIDEYKETNGDENYFFWKPMVSDKEAILVILGQNFICHLKYSRYWLEKLGSQTMLTLFTCKSVFYLNKQFYIDVLEQIRLDL
jgi:uncharacterized protein (DUF486 family)